MIIVTSFPSWHEHAFSSNLNKSRTDSGWNHVLRGKPLHMESIMFVILTGFLQRNCMWIFMMCLIRSLLDSFARLFQSFIFTYTTKKNLWTLSLSITYIFCHYFCSISPLLSFSPVSYYATGLQELVGPYGLWLLMRIDMGKLEIVFKCRWFKILVQTSGEWNSSIVYRFQFLPHSTLKSQLAYCRKYMNISLLKRSTYLNIS